MSQRKYTSRERNKHRKQEKKQRKKEKWQSKWDSMTEEEKTQHKELKIKEKKEKDELKLKRKERLLQSKENGIHIGFDLGFYDIYKSESDLTGIIRQLSYAYNANRLNENPFHFHLFNVNPKYWESLFKKSGVYNWNGVTIHQISESNESNGCNENKKNDVESECKACINIDLVNKSMNNDNSQNDNDNNNNNNKNKEKSTTRKISQIVYLSPDSSNVLKEIDDSSLYVIGGIVDRSIEKNKSLDQAKKFDRMCFFVTCLCSVYIPRLICCNIVAYKYTKYS